jgi:beta-glucosidase
MAIVIAGFDARDEGEYIGADTMSRPELLALFPPFPADFGAGAGPDVDLGTAVMTTGAGFGGDRDSLSLRPVDEQIIAAVAAANPRTVVALVAAGAVLTESWRSAVPAVVVMWYAGMEGGHALADVLTGAHNPSGRLPFSIPTSADHLPPFERDATAVTYDRFHGQRLLDRLGVPAAYPHGFGLSYTSFSITDAVVIDVTAEAARLAVTVANTGPRDGRHVVQVYGRSSNGPYAGERFLCGFTPVEVAAGASVTADVTVELLPLAAWNGAERVRPRPGDVTLEVGAFAHDPDGQIVTLG